MKTYKKRAKAGWETGKGAKQTSNRSERVYEKQEIRQELKEFEQGEDFKYRHKSKKPETELEKDERRLNWYKIKLQHWEYKTFYRGGDMFKSIVSRYKDAIKKLKKKIERQK